MVVRVRVRLQLRGQRLVTFIHLACFLWAMFSLSQNVGMPHSIRRESENTYGGRWKYLTFINQILQTLLFGICVVADFVLSFIPSKKNIVSSQLWPLRDSVFSVLVFPVGLFVAVTFWTLYAYDRELIYPKELDEINPYWLNHTMHTTILPLLLIELVACPHRYLSKLKGMIGLSIFGTSYLTCFRLLIGMMNDVEMHNYLVTSVMVLMGAEKFICHSLFQMTTPFYAILDPVLWVNYASGIWAYPILEVLGLPGKAVLFMMSYLVMAGFYLLGEHLTKFLWGDFQKYKK